ncbi:Hypothetical predicted protein [Mytilus galloprovincialis]|uniref:Uncharacterized protein n=1 Tax=Mytilus galloprovincialis TaxID=29158 RepID=A0A8B6GMK3_MYTGA|nr:Hypothetical predicted protein [Mytilus galloprovincialis]
MTSKLKSIRVGHRSAVSRILRRFGERSETEVKPEEDELEIILDTLKEKQDILKDLDKNILDSVQEEDIEQEILDSDEYKFNLGTKIRKNSLEHAVTEDTSFEIRLLVGADQYWDIVKDDITRGEGPTAEKSKLGYLLSGPLKRTSSINETNFSTSNLGETEETHITEDKTERNTINNEHISTIVETSRTKQRTTGPLKVNKTDNIALMRKRDINQNKCFYDDLQGMGKSKFQFKQLNLYK